MRLPNPTVREVRWSFIVVFACAVTLTGTITWGVVQKIDESDRIVAIAAANADQVQRLNTQLDAQAEAAKAQRLQLQRANHEIKAQLRALLRYLRAHRIAVPQTALTPIPGATPQATVTRPKAPTPRGPRPSPSHAAEPAPTPPPSPTTSPGPVGSLCDLLTAPACPLH